MNKFKKIIERIRHSYYDIFQVLAFVVAMFLVIWFMPRMAKFKYEYQKLRPWQHETLYAPFDFPLYKSDEQLAEERNAALSGIDPIFVFNTKKTSEIRNVLLKDFEQQWTGPEEDMPYYRDMLMKLYDTIENKGVIAHVDFIDNIGKNETIDVVKDRVMKKRKIGEFYSIKTMHDTLSLYLSDIKDNKYIPLLNKLLINSLHPNVEYSEDLSNKAKEQALASLSETFGMVVKDELIISEGEIVTEDKYMILTSLEKKYDSITDNEYVHNNYLLYGQIIIVAFIFILLFLMLKYLCPDVFEELRNINLILVLMMLGILSSFLVIKYLPNLIYVVPVALLSILLITFFNAKVVIIVQVLTLTIISLVVPNSFQYYIIQLFVSIASIFLLLRRNTRSSYFLTSILVFVMYVLIDIGVKLLYEGGVGSYFVSDMAVFLLNAVLTMLALPLAFLFERMFGFVTDLSLLELSNTNSPLLRKLSSEAPGTFQHALQVANLCEEVIYMIGGNMLLVRTGAMYHDIGKIRYPYYFVENQNGSYNPHEDLTNIESARMIINHVIDGIELCRKFHIPEQVIDFVRTHHGTRRTEYFYRKEKLNNPNLEDDSSFRYHGPVPFSKETAVLMMVDSVEAASRSLKDKNEQSISDLVDNIINAQIADNQFANSNITFKDITVVKKVLKKKLKSIYHIRIAYPD